MASHYDLTLLTSAPAPRRVRTDGCAVSGAEPNSGLTGGAFKVKSISPRAGCRSQLAGIWQWLALDGMVTAEDLHAGLERLSETRGNAWTPVLLIIAYVVASLIVFPLSVFVLATGLIFGPWLGFCYALTGTMFAAASTYWVGRLLGREAILRHGGKRINDVAHALSRRGTIASLVVAFLPLAPFTLTNMAAGALRIRLGHSLAGTLIGIAPGVLAVTVIGSELRALLSAESAAAVLWSAAGIAGVVAVLILFRRYVGRSGPGGG